MTLIPADYKSGYPKGHFEAPFHGGEKSLLFVSFKISPPDFIGTQNDIKDTLLFKSAGISVIRVIRIQL
jgi:hypothetical protein